MMRKILTLLIVLLPALIVAQGNKTAQNSSIVFNHVTVIDVTGAPSKSDMTVIVTGNQISAIGKTGKLRVPKKAQMIDATGKFLIPGLWDMHVHLLLATELALPVLIANGVTGVRDMGGEIDQIDEWRSRITSGKLFGPRIVRAGLVVDGKKTDAPFRHTVTNATEARQAVNSLKHLGVDFIKIHNAVPREAYFALADEARKQNIAFAGHIPKEVTPAEASDAGQRSIEHTESLFDNILFGVSQRGQSAKDGLNQAFAAYADEKAATLFQRFRQNGTWYDPVLVTYRSFAFRTDFAANPDPRNRYVAASTKQLWDKHQPVNKDTPAETIALRKSVFERFITLVDLMQREKVNLLAGTDAGGIRDVVPGFGLHDELILLVQAGLKPIEALQAATINPAKYLNMTDLLGTIEKGKLADLVLLDANPLADISNTRKINAVVVNGRLLKREDLDEMLNKVAEKAKQ
jgi:hypothetical protein